MVSKFWVGGSGTWDASDTTHWGTGSGTGNPSAVPTSADTVTFDANSTGTIVVNHASLSITTLTTNAFAGTLDFATNNNAMAITSGGWNNNGTGTRTITLGSNVITVTSGANPFNWGTTTNCTFNAGTSEIIITGGTTAAIRAVPLGSTGLSYNKITLAAITSGFHSTAFAHTGSSATIALLTINSGNWVTYPTTPTLNVGTLVINGISGTPCALVSGTISTSAPMAITNASTPTWCAFRDCTFTGGSVIASNSLNLGRNTGITINEPAGGGGGSFGMVGG